MSRPFAQGLLVAVAVFLLVASFAVAGEEGAASPTEVAQKLQAASKTQDMSVIAPLVHPDDRAKLAFGLTLGAAMAAGFSDDSETATKEFDALTKKHGVKDAEPAGTPPENEEEFAMAARKMFKDVDLLAYIPELFAFLSKHMKDKEMKEGPFGTGKIENLKIEGDVATATDGDEKVEFGRVGDRWFIRLKD
jgi:hypothetical protein